MIFSPFKNKYQLLVGITLPIFLFNLVFAGNIFAASQNIKIIFAIKDNSVETLSQQYDLQNVNLLYVDTKNESLKKTYVAEIDSNRYQKFSADKKITYAELDREFKASAILPNDKYFTSDSFNEVKQWYLPRIRMPEAWEFARDAAGVTVAIIDTGIHAGHIELNDGRVVSGFNTLTNTAIAANTNSDDNGHGTAVAGIIGAISDNTVGIAGIAKSVRLMPLKALQADGTGGIATVSAAIVWAVDHGANIINLSLGGPGFGADKTLNDAIAHAYESGAVIIAAAGNDLAENGINLDSAPVYPICSDGGKNMVIGVAASDPNDKKASFSNFGINCVDITAPGKKILTTAYLPSDPSDSILIYGSGTSLATPVVAGIAALLKGKNFALTNNQIRDILLRTTDNIDLLNANNCLGSSCNGFLGRGRLNALQALSPQPLLNGSFVRETSSGKIYQMVGGAKRHVSGFVFDQRGYSQADVIPEFGNQLQNILTLDPLPPLEGTLVKGAADPTVYLIHDQLKRPLTFLVFKSRNFSFANVKTMPDVDLNPIKAGEWYWPPDGTMVLIKGDPTVYVMDKETRRPVTYFVFTQRKLSFAKVVTVSQDEFTHIPKAMDAYWMPPIEGTLVKSTTSPTVYLIQDGSRKPISGTAFVNRKYSFSKIVSIPQAEIDVIMPGSPILN